MRREFAGRSPAPSLACRSHCRGGAARPTEITFYYPIAVGGPITKIIDGYVADFEKENPDIKVQAGLCRHLSGHDRQGADRGQERRRRRRSSVLLSTDMFTLIDEDAIAPYRRLREDDDDQAWLEGFYPAFMENSQTGGKTWGIPFQRSTIVLYWNKDAFKEAGLDPDKAPATWDEMVAFGKKLTKRDAGGNVTQWGVEIPSSGFPYWLFQALTTQNGAMLDERGRHRDATSTSRRWSRRCNFGPTCQQKYKVIRPASSSGARRRRISSRRKTAMMWTTTGNLTNVRRQRQVPVRRRDAAGRKRPAARRPAAATSISSRKRRRSRRPRVEFIKWMTTPERAADWGIDTGYVAVRARRLGHGGDEEICRRLSRRPPSPATSSSMPSAELRPTTTSASPRRSTTASQAALTGTKTADQAMKEAQAEAERILKAYQYARSERGRRCRLPAIRRAARLDAHPRLAAAAAGRRAAGDVHPLCRRSRPSSTASSRRRRARRPRVFVGVDNIGRCSTTRSSGRRLQQQSVYALVTHSARRSRSRSRWRSGSTAASPARGSCGWRSSRRPCCR